MTVYFDDFVRDIERTATVDEAKIVLQKTIEALGFVSFDYGLGTLRRPIPLSTADAELRLHLATFDWTSHYIAQGYQHVDRATLRSLTQAMPWLYWDVFARPAESALQAEMEQDVRSMVSSGLAIPLHGLGLNFGQMHLGSRLSRAEFERLDREIRPIATLVSAYFHDHVGRLLGPVASASPLSARERECLLWAARGKTAWEIGAILGVSERMARAHIASSMRKLDVSTRAHAVARAVAERLIEP